MAITTTEHKLSLLALQGSPGVVLPDPTEVFSQGTRQHLLERFSGVLFAAIVEGGGTARKAPRRLIGEIDIRFDLGSLLIEALVENPKPVALAPKQIDLAPVETVSAQGALGGINIAIELMGGLRLRTAVDNSQSDRVVEEELIQVILLTS